MARRDPAAKRYAQAVFAIARDQDAFDRWRADLATLAALFAEPSVRAFLASASYPWEGKADALERGMDGAHPHALSLAKLLVRKGRVSIAPEIAEAFAALVDAARHVVVARVTTAVPLTDAARETLTDTLRRRTAAQEVRLEEAVVREILGGAILQVGDHVVDGSLRTRLQNLRRSLQESAV